MAPAFKQLIRHGCERKLSYSRGTMAAGFSGHSYSMPRRLPLVLAIATLAGCASQPPAPFSSADACSVTASSYESRDVQCRFPQAQNGRKFRFKANFTGGHDDTSARIDSFMNDAPLDCDEGSKQNLFAEDGDISLWCNFAPAGAAPGNSILKVQIHFSHARFVDYEIAPQ
jgi:hypothetical protein